MFKKRGLILVMALFVFSMARLSFAMDCGEHQSAASEGHSGHQMEAASTAAKDVSVATNVGNKVCPVTGEKIDEATKAIVEYKGKIYNLCCPACIEEFNKDPQKYIEKLGVTDQKSKK